MKLRSVQNKKDNESVQFVFYLYEPNEIPFCSWSKENCQRNDICLNRKGMKNQCRIDHIPYIFKNKPN